MKFFTTLALAAGAVAAPAMQELDKRVNLKDVQILNYALTLEHLENAFYRDGIAKFGPQPFADLGLGKFFYANLMEISSDEATHVQFLTGAITGLGKKAVSECTYDFGYGDSAAAFLTVANILEGVGITAYLGAAKSIMSKQYLTYAGSVLTVESRHSSYLRSRAYNPRRSPFPQAFDTPLTPNEVYSLASQFIVSCPSTDPVLPLKAFPVLNVISNYTVIPPGGKFQVTAPDWGKFKGKYYAFFITVLGPFSVPATPVAGSKGKTLEITAPGKKQGIAGQSYLVITNNAENVTDDTIIAGPAIVDLKAPYLGKFKLQG